MLKNQGVAMSSPLDLHSWAQSEKLLVICSIKSVLGYMVAPLERGVARWVDDGLVVDGDGILRKTVDVAVALVQRLVVQEQLRPTERVVVEGAREAVRVNVLGLEFGGEFWDTAGGCNRCQVGGGLVAVRVDGSRIKNNLDLIFFSTAPNLELQLTTFPYNRKATSCARP